jgi:hypothetical protein
MQPSSTTPRTALPVDKYRLHEDVSINFQLHRWIAWTGGDALPDIDRIAPRLTDYPTNRRLFLELAELPWPRGPASRRVPRPGRRVLRPRRRPGQAGAATALRRADLEQPRHE